MTPQQVKTLSSLLMTINTAQREIEILLENQSPPKASRPNPTLEEFRKSFITGKITKPSKLKQKPKKRQRCYPDLSGDANMI